MGFFRPVLYRHAVDGLGRNPAQRRSGPEAEGEPLGCWLLSQGNGRFVHRAVSRASCRWAAGIEAYRIADAVLPLAWPRVEPLPASDQTSAGRGGAVSEERLR